MGAGLEFHFCTLIDTPLSCTQFSAPKVRNSILFGTTSADVLGAASSISCDVNYAILTPQSKVLVGTGLHFGVDPRFKNATTQDFHLMAGSPAVDAADPTVQDAHDFDGTARPQGAASDLGAFELH